MRTQTYPTDLTDRHWDCIKDLIPAAKAGGRPRSLDMRQVINAILYILVSGAQWRADGVCTAGRELQEAAAHLGGWHLPWQVAGLGERALLVPTRAGVALGRDERLCTTEAALGSRADICLADAVPAAG